MISGSELIYLTGHELGHVASSCPDARSIIFLNSMISWANAYTSMTSTISLGLDMSSWHDWECIDRAHVFYLILPRRKTRMIHELIKFWCWACSEWLSSWVFDKIIKNPRRFLPGLRRFLPGQRRFWPGQHFGAKHYDAQYQISISCLQLGFAHGWWSDFG